MTATPLLHPEFPILQRLDYLNHAAVAPIPARAAQALARFAAQAAEQGGDAWPQWAAALRGARQRAGELLGVHENEIGFVHNTTHGLLCVANSLRWRPGDNVVVTQGDFPANYHPWRNLGELGVALRQVVPRADHRFTVDDFLPLIDANTRVLAVSLASYATGFRMPVETLAEACRARGVLLCVDAIQAMGAMPTRVAELGCDFIVADGHKWLLGPEGIGILWMRPELDAQLNASMTGWVGRTRPWDYADMQQPLHAGARRFEEGSHNMLGATALGESLGLLLETGLENIWSAIERHTAHLREGLARGGWSVVSPAGEGERSGIIACTRAGYDPAAVLRALAARKIALAARGGFLRISPHFYNTAEQIERLLAALAELKPEELTP